MEVGAVSEHEDLYRPAVRPSDSLAPFTDRLRLAVAAYLARFQGASRYHTESDLRCYLVWCAEHGLDPADRPPCAPGVAISV